MKLMMSAISGTCFLTVLALGYAQENSLQVTLLRAVIAMLAGLLLSRWWGLTIRKQLAIIFLDDLKQKETTLSEQAANPTAQQEPEPTDEPKVDTE
tara:strand:- start:67 stop:354 length:288 start_codon:yes stop_codon:yes gene_type:complete